MKQHFCPAEQSMIAFEKECNWCGELESQEPVAWMDADGNVSDNNDHKCFPIPLYTHPPQRTWVGLTNDEIAVIHANYPNPQGFALALQAKLKELNT